MSTIYTIGFTQKPLRQFLDLLRNAGVDAIIDIRLRNTSQLAGWAKRDDLETILSLVNIAYEHQSDLSPTAEILDTYRKDGEWLAYVRNFRPLIVSRQIEQIGAAIFTRHQSPCLLCSEATADQCHRRLVAEYWSHHLPGLQIVHL